MKNFLKAFIIVISILIIPFANVGYEILFNRTVGKEIESSKSYIFKESQSYVDGKRQEALKMYKEYILLEDEDKKQALRNVVAMSFAEFDENKLSGEIRNFVYRCKYR